MKTMRFTLLATFALVLTASLLTPRISFADTRFFYSDAAREHQVSFKSTFRTSETSMDYFGLMDQDSRAAFTNREIAPMMSFLFGPLTRRAMGGTLRTESIEVDWSAARLANGRVELPYEYHGIWIVQKELAARGSFELPVPLNTDDLMTRYWKSCTDSDPDHQTESFFWYFWDPARFGCDHVEGQHYATVKVLVGAQTPNQEKTMPEYQRMFRVVDGKKHLNLTIAFGYVQDIRNPSPDIDYDQGMREYRSFLWSMRVKWALKFSDTPIRQGEYKNATDPDLVIGHRFEGELNGVQVTLNVVTAAGVDQMELFAKSFAHDHDAFFAWFGHSRVGAGFDAQQFGRMLTYDPEYYTITPDYQVIYWGGCNSYSYYTQPFFDFKVAASGGADPHGTKGLDIVANGLPSYFSLNSEIAEILVNQFTSWDENQTYQQLVNLIELTGRQSGQKIFAAVIGDEDNATSSNNKPAIR